MSDLTRSTRRLWRAFRLTAAQLCLVAAAGLLATGGWRLSGLDAGTRLLFYTFLAVGVTAAIRPVVGLVEDSRS